MSAAVRRRRVFALALMFTILSAGLPALPRAATPVPAPLPEPASAETLAKPKFASAAVMPSGQVGLLYANGDNGVNTSAEIRFTRYTGEHAVASSIQLSTAGPAYPQLATFKGRLVAGYVDTRAGSVGRFILRASDDSGVTWSSEPTPFGTETFDGYGFAPRLVASRDAQTLYLFTAANNAIPQYRSTTDSTLASWGAAVAAGDSSMRVASGNNCGSAGSECYRAHSFSFMETATAGKWIYIAKSDSGYGQSGRGTQVGSLGGIWSPQVDHLGSGGVSGGGDSTATTFLGRQGYVYFVRATGGGEQLYVKRSTDGGYTWDDRIYAYIADQPAYVTGAPVGLYVPGYSLGEYVWYAGWGGAENTLRVTPLWTGPHGYSDSGTVRLLGSAGGDLDDWSARPDTFGRSLFGERAAFGGYTTSATDLALPGRKLGLAFTRWYNSGDPLPSPLGPGWTHSFNWKLLESPATDYVELRRGDGRVDRFTKNADQTYSAPLGVFDTLVRNGDGSFTLTTPAQTKFDLRGPSATVQGDVARGRTRFVLCTPYQDPWTYTAATTRSTATTRAISSRTSALAAKKRPGAWISPKGRRSPASGSSPAATARCAATTSRARSTPSPGRSATTRSPTSPRATRARSRSPADPTTRATGGSAATAPPIAASRSTRSS